MTSPVSPPEPLRRRLRARALDLATLTAARLPVGLLRAGLRGLGGLASLSSYEQLCLRNLELALGAETSAAERSIRRGSRSSD